LKNNTEPLAPANTPENDSAATGANSAAVNAVDNNIFFIITLIRLIQCTFYRKS
jgi:hypothetical protein